MTTSAHDHVQFKKQVRFCDGNMSISNRFEGRISPELQGTICSADWLCKAKNCSKTAQEFNVIGLSDRDRNYL